MTGMMMRTCTVTGWSTGDNPVCTAICPDLPALVNGGISYNPTTTPRLQGAMVTHFCTVVGYQLSSSTITRTCQSTRMWSGSSLICNPVSCGSPPTITNGMMISSTGTTFGETATYTCSTGYQRSGSATITCQASGSWSTAPVCTAICDDLPALANGIIVYNPTSTPRLQGTTATHFCTVAGYQLSSSTTTRTCQSNRTWSGSPIACERNVSI
ncbi:sushi, von Willebrand factor type A, EGF and pentraxin domain-containing protein 1-like [Halichondria panicea]|uniref:sushi, von Willebrand factor type A, EGF and pentraxin domain-containing protein 1-like n=1 Tax=Halichondria panicea TaxID=6063 RepID=UPI00312BA1E8